ncbi:hypothetical protein ODZ83_05685 [Acaricomes phytoseiuli]|uniref:septum site-determining protein Ssd n=1 Tax=Acaricomes phytoseiuli TaxID=291968 RepID=UPI002221C3D7|nr:septum site-determining protein Ssd [Acaricomes phytoseiuli]MCW1249683.1 hypothetical protein [Acaricomes phytoseiuli]
MAAARRNPPRGQAPQPRVPPRSRRLVLLGGSEEEQEAVRSVAAAAGLELSLGPETTDACAVLATPEALSARLPRSADVPLIGVSVRDDSKLWEASMRASADHVAPLPQAAPWLAGFLSHSRDRPERARAISVIGASGGAGASTLALLLSRSITETSAKVLTVDADPSGAGLEFLFGITVESALSWHDLPTDGRPLDPARFHSALPSAQGCHLLGFGSQPVRPEALAVDAALTAASEAFDAVIIDLGRGGIVDAESQSPGSSAVGRGAIGSEVLSRSDLVLCLVPATVPGMLSARRMKAALPGAFLVSRGPFPEGLDAERMAEALEMPLLGSLPRLRKLIGTADPDQVIAMARHRTVRRLRQDLLGELRMAQR